MEQNKTNELYHHGVLGMKWGRRKNRMSQDAREVKAIKKKKVSQMSNAELRKLNDRQNLENQHRNLNSQRNVGKKAVQSFIGVAGTIVAVEAAAKTYKRVADYAIDKIGKTKI